LLLNGNYRRFALPGPVTFAGYVRQLPQQVETSSKPGVSQTPPTAAAQALRLGPFAAATRAYVDAVDAEQSATYAAQTALGAGAAQDEAMAQLNSARATMQNLAQQYAQTGVDTRSARLLRAIGEFEKAQTDKRQTIYQNDVKPNLSDNTMGWSAASTLELAFNDGDQDAVDGQIQTLKRQATAGLIEEMAQQARADAAQLAVDGSAYADAIKKSGSDLAAAARTMAQHAQRFLDQGGDSPAANLIRAIDKFESAPADEKQAIYERDLQPAISNESTGFYPDPVFNRASFQNDETTREAIATLKTNAMNSLYRELAGRFEV
jgi:hypothetical protein